MQNYWNLSLENKQQQLSETVYYRDFGETAPSRFKVTNSRTPQQIIFLFLNLSLQNVRKTFPSFHQSGNFLIASLKNYVASKVYFAKTVCQLSKRQHFELLTMVLLKLAWNWKQTNFLYLV